jgi:hypothetical protein
MSGLEGLAKRLVVVLVRVHSGEQTTAIEDQRQTLGSVELFSKRSASVGSLPPERSGSLRTTQRWAQSVEIGCAYLASLTSDKLTLSRLWLANPFAESGTTMPSLLMCRMFMARLAGSRATTATASAAAPFGGFPDRTLLETGNLPIAELALREGQSTSPLHRWFARPGAFSRRGPEEDTLRQDGYPGGDRGSRRRRRRDHRVAIFADSKEEFA